MREPIASYLIRVHVRPKEGVDDATPKLPTVNEMSQASADAVRALLGEEADAQVDVSATSERLDL